MIDFIKKLKQNLITILPEHENLVVLNIPDMVENYERYINEFESAVELLSKTIENNDKVAIQCALTRVRIASLNLSNCYHDVVDDVVLINKSESWPAIPNDYKIPEHYNYSKEGANKSPM
ncbi:MAG: hypothetical protein ACRC2N_05280 [Aeromonas sp.]|uniref:hypothetical protein n=1 Tax=Aeromonas jandaei TaxID=650 RepID=UPI001ABFC604|nr:hypothetical protein [Aeromonas jandaei]QSR74255.1 hypothetical protein GP488_18240 [Aeromonas jandaei]